LRRYFLDGSATPEPLKCLEGKILTGLAVRDGSLYACDSTDNVVHVLRADDLQEQCRFAFERPGNLAVDPNGNLWIIRNPGESASGPAMVLHCKPDGTPLPEKITGVQTPRGIAVNLKDGRVYVPDYAADMQIHIFNADGGHASDFGDPGGIYGGVRGEVKPTKFDCPLGVGIDAQGNLYVAAAGPKTSRGTDLISGTGTELRKFSPSGEGRSRTWTRLPVDSPAVGSSAARPVGVGGTTRAGGGVSTASAVASNRSGTVSCILMWVIWCTVSLRLSACWMFSVV
jgi:DNA-binding beta-propeller fold protein YncE